MSDFMNSFNDFARLPRHPAPEESAKPDKSGKGGSKTEKFSFSSSFQSVFTSENQGLIEGVKFLKEIASGLQVKCTQLGRQILVRELAAFSNGELSYDEFKARNGTGSVLLFTEKEKEQFRSAVAGILDQTKPGLAKAITMFGDRMCHLMGLEETEIAAAVIPQEIEALSSGRMNYMDFRERNTYYVFEKMTEREIEIARVAFLRLGPAAFESQDFEMDREILLDPDCQL